ncbi:MAG: carbohydrate binding family 9 domain-containing protein [Candidatus Marinimicrobia bacterium]|nr:carbohydrate binding family 9 domain-containing protein [Candidatus Neomarinimicrobiota bacterium]
MVFPNEYPGETNSLNLEPVISFETGQSKQMLATRTPHPPLIDGSITDDMWSLAIPTRDFIQESPENLVAPTESTEVRILYDDNCLYVLVQMFDNKPGGIKKRIARRDDWMRGFEGSSDWFTIDLDSRFDHQTAFIFGVNAAGVKVDAVAYDDADYDMEWNAVWQAEVSVNDKGWIIELAIPFSILRFDDIGTMTWGINMGRYIQRKNEHITWIPEPRGVQGIVSRYGILTGLKDIPQPRQLEITPYIISGNLNRSGQELTEPDWDPFAHNSLEKQKRISNMGLDLKYGLGSNATIDLTINPDYGQIEADPADINLTYFETYFLEKRPFFIENSTIFDTPIEMFYSRRIGSDENRILAAGKYTGKTANGLGFGLLSAVTSNRNSSNWMDDFNQNHITSFFAGRIIQDVLDGNSYMGGMVTSKIFNNYSATSLSADQFLYLANNRINLDQQFAVSDTNGIGGWAYSGDIEYHNQNNFTSYINFEHFSKKFYVDDLGFNSRNNVEYISTGFSYLQQDPVGFVRYGSAGISFDYAANLDDLILNRTVNINIEFTNVNYWSTSFGFSRSFEYYDDKLTYDSELKELGPDVKLPETDGAYFTLQSDYTNPLVFSTSLVYGSNKLGDWGRHYSVNILSRLFDRLELSLNFNRNRSFEKFHWLEITNEDVISNGNLQTYQHFMFTNSMNRLDIVTLRASFGLSTNMSIDAYSEYYVKRNSFTENTLYELLEPGQYPEITDYDPYSNEPMEDGEELLHPNLYVGLYPKYTSLNFNFVFRWEFRPGSTFYLVYTNFKDINGMPTSSIFDFWNNDGHGKWIEYEKNHSIMMKIDYWFNI